MDKAEKAFERLEKNVTDVIAEQQLKLGYRREQVSLYYPGGTLKNLLCLDGDGQLGESLRAFAAYAEPRLGAVGISRKGDRFCFVIPPEGSAYVHEHMEEQPFLTDFLSAVAAPDGTLQRLLAVFEKYSDKVHAEKLDGEGFDYLLFFEDGVPDDYRYCIKLEECHTVYHRFIPEDYRDYHFKEGNII